MDRYPQSEPDAERVVRERPPSTSAGDRAGRPRPPANLTMFPDDLGQAVVDTFRVEDGRIVEHWDVMQPVPVKASNDNGMF